MGDRCGLLDLFCECVRTAFRHIFKTKSGRPARIGFVELKEWPYNAAARTTHGDADRRAGPRKLGED